MSLFFVLEITMELLRAVNTILPKLGEHPVTSLEVKHPTLAIILPVVQHELDTLLGAGWWFNTAKYTAYPDSEKHIALPTDTLSFIPADAPASVRGLRLYNQSTLTFEWDTPVLGELITALPFHEIPNSAANVVLYQSLVNAFVTDIGLEQEVQAWQVKLTAANAVFLSEHLRNKKYSARKSPRHLRMLRAMRG